MLKILVFSIALMACLMIGVQSGAPNQVTGQLSGVTDSCATVRCGYGAVCELQDGRAKCVCPDKCPTNYAPVCGSDGVTYGNKCTLGIASCKQGKPIAIAYQGRCGNNNKHI